MDEIMKILFHTFKYQINSQEKCHEKMKKKAKQKSHKPPFG